jgi:sigma-E factor negative regulatory protein RseB
MYMPALLPRQTQVISIFSLFLSITFSSLAVASESNDATVANLLKKMAESSHGFTYQGVFTYQHKDNPNLQGFKVSHWLENGVEHERLLHLNGPEREIIRSGKQLGCGSLGDELLLGRFALLGADMAHLDQLYKFEIRGPERVAGRQATVLWALPLDSFRYSFFLSIDNETGLVLKSWLVDEAARPLERYQFIDLAINPDLSQMQQQVAAKLSITTSSQLAECNPQKLQQPQKWQLKWVPPGFVFVGQRVVQGDIDMLMYTDGLTTFSVFVQASHSAIPLGVAQRGATLAVMDVIEYKQQSYRITVVGEIPNVSAQKIAQNISGL